MSNKLIKITSVILVGIGFLFISAITQIDWNTQIKNKPFFYISVKDFPYNAKGDGIKDDTLSIRAAIADLSSSGGELLFPPGSYLTDTITLPIYPKIIHIKSPGAILIAAHANLPVFNIAGVVSNVTSPSDDINIGIMANASGSTGPAIDMHGMNFTNWNVTFYSNGTGNFAQGFLCSDGSPYNACYHNKITFRVTDQTGPTTVVEMDGTANDNSFPNCVSVNNSTGVTSVFKITEGLSQTNISDGLFQGNSIATVFNGTGDNLVLINDYLEANGASLIASGYGLTMIGGDLFNNGTNNGITCNPSGTTLGVNWSFINVAMQYPHTISGCVNSNVQNGGLSYGTSISQLNGGLTLTSVNGPSSGGTYLQYNQSTGLSAGTYEYCITALTTSGESTCVQTTLPITITTGQSPAVITPLPNPSIGAISYNYYRGDSGCTSTDTCNYLKNISAENFYSQSGWFSDDGTISLDTSHHPPLLNTTGYMVAPNFVSIGASVTNSTNEANTGSLIYLNFDTALYNHGNVWITNNPRLTATVAGVYLISASVEFASNATGTRYILVQVNGGGANPTVAYKEIPALTNGNPTQVTLSCIKYLNVGDYLLLLAGQSSGGSLDILASANYSPTFSMQLMLP